MLSAARPSVSLHDAMLFCAVGRGWHGAACRGLSRLCPARQSPARRRVSWRREAGRSQLSLAMPAVLCLARPSIARPGSAGQGWHGGAQQCLAERGGSRPSPAWPAGSGSADHSSTMSVLCAAVAVLARRRLSLHSNGQQSSACPRYARHVRQSKHESGPRGPRETRKGNAGVVLPILARLGSAMLCWSRLAKPSEARRIAACRSLSRSCPAVQGRRGFAVPSLIGPSTAALGNALQSAAQQCPAGMDGPSTAVLRLSRALRCNAGNR